MPSKTKAELQKPASARTAKRVVDPKRVSLTSSASSVHGTLPLTRPMLANGLPSRIQAILSLQRTAGNRATGLMLQRLAARPIQPKLSVGPAGDPYEREADAAADRLVASKLVERPSRLPAAGLHRRPETTEEGPVQRSNSGASKTAKDKRALRDQMRTLLKVRPIDLEAMLQLINGASLDVRRTLYDYAYIRMQIVDALNSSALVRVMSSILSGIKYSPGWESDVYWSQSDTDRDSVNNRVDGWFKFQTGVTKKLDPKNSMETPLVRLWLQMRDVIIETDIGREIEEEKKKKNKANRFAKYLKEAVDKMKGVAFGSALDLPPKLAPGSKPKIKYWDLIRDTEMASVKGREQQGMLIYKGGASPATAVDELFKEKNLNKWALDCIEFVQATHMYARRHTLGYGGFNKSVNASGGALVLRLKNSTGYRATLVYVRSSPSAPMKMRTRPGKSTEVSTSVKELLDRAPVGSRIVWRNLKKKGTSFFNENAVKLGKNRYAAHGFTGQNVFTRAKLEKALAETSYKPADGDFETYKNANVFVRKIEHVEAP